MKTRILPALAGATLFAALTKAGRYFFGTPNANGTLATTLQRVSQQLEDLRVFEKAVKVFRARTFRGGDDILRGIEC